MTTCDVLRHLFLYSRRLATRILV